ncbi:MAG: fused MFS/spermidine synthase, partial [Myxococcota bacterium]
PLGDRARSPLFLYGLLEAGIGLCALILPTLFEFVSQVSATRLHAPVDASNWFPFGASLLLILVPTTLMGGTLPVLGRYVASFSLPRGSSLGLLYAANTFGAVVGTLATGFFLVRTIGVANSTFLAAALNLAVAAASFGLARAWQTTATATGEAVPVRNEPAIQSPPPDGSMRRAVLLLYFVNGFSGLGLQILWTRAFSLFGTNTTYAFTVVLTTFLLGLAGGSVLGSTLASGRQARPGLLAALQSLLALVAAITPACLGLVGVDLFSGVEEKFAAIGQAGKILSACVIAGLFMLPATVLMGACFPLVAQILAGSTDRVGRVLGRAYALNTLGAVAGSLIAAFVLLPWIGIEYSILVIACITAASGLLLALRARAALSSALSLAALFGTLALMLTTPGHFRAMLEQKLGQTLVFYQEGIEATIGVFESDRARRPVLVINNSVLEDRGVVHKLLAHLPALLHPDPQRALVLGFGVGITSKAFAAHGLPVNDCVEISPGVIDAAPFFGDLNGQIIERGDESFRLFVADGRKLLRAGGEPYDIIALDANSGDLHNAGVGKLYTREFFELARDRLSPDGMISLYASTGFSPAEFAMVVRTFQQVFPHSSLWIDRIYGETSVLLGSMKKLSIDLPNFLDKAMHPPVRADLAELGLEDPGLLLSSFLMGEEILRVFARDADLNTDDRPLLEFFSLEREPFANDDRVVSDLGWGLHRDSVIRILDRKHPHPLSRSTLETIEASTRASALLLDHLVYLWSGDGGHSATALRIASSLDKQAEFLRTATGTGVEALADAEDRMARHPSAGNVFNLALLKAARGDCAGALPLLQRALDLDDSRLGRDPRSALHLVAARCLRELGRLEAAREQLRDARRLGSETSLEEAELALAEAGSGEGCRLDLLDAKAQAAFGLGDVAAAHEAFLELESCGRRRPSDLARHAQ